MNPNEQTDDEWAPLHLACSQGHCEAVKQLVVVGKANVNANIGARGTPLHCAASNGKIAIVAYLLIVKVNTEYNNDVELFRLKNSLGKKAIDVCSSEKIIWMIKRTFETKAQRMSESSKSKTKELKLTIKKTLMEQTNYIPPMPPKLSGLLEERESGKLLGTFYYALNPLEGTFIKYKKKENFPLIPSEVIELSKIDQVQIYMKAKPFKFEVIDKKKRSFSCEYQNATILWGDYIKSAVEYSAYVKELSKLAYDETLAESKRAGFESTLNDVLSTQLMDIEINNKTGAETPKTLPFSSLSSTKSSRESSKGEMLREDIKEKEGKALPPLPSEEKKEAFKMDDETVMLASFELVKMVGSGSFGKIIKVIHKATKKIYAMKVFSKSLLMKSNYIRFAVAECQALKKLSNPFVLSLYYAFHTKKNLYLILDYCEGGDLGELMALKNIFEEDVARFYIAEVILAIEYLHSLNLIYRDMKPENILFCTEMYHFS